MIIAEEQRHDAGRGRAHEALDAAPALQRIGEIGDVRLGGFRIAHGNRRIAGRRLAARAARIAEHAVAQLRKILEVAVAERVAGAAETVEPVLDVGGVGGLRHLAVVDEVDAGSDLLVDDFGHGLLDARSQRLGLDRYAALLGIHHADEIIGPRQAAGVRRQKAFGRAFHSWSSRVRLSALLRPTMLAQPTPCNGTMEWLVIGSWPRWRRSAGDSFWRGNDAGNLPAEIIVETNTCVRGCRQHVSAIEILQVALPDGDHHRPRHIQFFAGAVGGARRRLLIRFRNII